ncbi:MAG: hypothetical protein PSY12_06095 [bacterium]|nr:hypothetical protein [bacterium]
MLWPLNQTTGGQSSMLLIMYWVMTLCCCLYASVAGRATGRAGAAVILFKTIAGFYAALMDQSWAHTAYAILTVDMICLIAFLAIALRSPSLWPLWTTGCLLAAAVVHLASVAQIGIEPTVYQGLKDLWAFPMQLFMVRGISLDLRYRRLHIVPETKPA